MVSKEVKDSIAHVIYVLLIIAFYFWLLAFIIPEFITLHQLIMWLSMNILLYPIFVTAILVAGRYAIAAGIRGLFGKIKGLVGRFR
jgi:hypothetical protein